MAELKYSTAIKCSFIIQGHFPHSQTLTVIQLVEMKMECANQVENFFRGGNK